MSNNKVGLRIMRAIVGITAFFLFFASMGNVGTAVENIGSICIRYFGHSQNDEKIMLAGAEFVIYKIGTIENNEWVLTEEFEDSHVSLKYHTASGRKKQAAQLLDYAVNRKIKGTVKKTNESGEALYDNLSEGVYLSAQTKEFVNKDKERFTSEPSLVSIPTDINGDVIYQLTIEPKSERNESKPPENVATGDMALIRFYVMIMLLCVAFGCTIYLKRCKPSGSFKL